MLYLQRDGTIAKSYYSRLELNIHAVCVYIAYTYILLKEKCNSTLQNEIMRRAVNEDFDVFYQINLRRVCFRQQFEVHSKEELLKT